MTSESIQAEVQNRAEAYLPQRQLLVDYYRIRMKLAYPLPIESLTEIEIPTPRPHKGYPWATWMTWALEERIDALGWAATWSMEERFSRKVQEDLQALANWPLYRDPDSWNTLPTGHALRTLWKAWSQWDWVSGELKETLAQAFARNLDDMLPQSEKWHGELKRKEDILESDSPHKHLHNIPLIGTLGTALGANAIAHPSASILNGRLTILIGALLELRAKDYHEAVAYDGYVLDFVCDWMASLPEPEREPILAHPRLNDYFEQSCRLSAPGNLLQVAELGDVEPFDMPFHVSAQAKLQGLRPDLQRAWYLSQCDITRLRTDALASMRAAVTQKNGTQDISTQPPSLGALEAHQAMVLRSGWTHQDLAVAVSASASPYGHIQNDAGSLVIGSRGRWVIDDPGYQQYLKTSEREFSIGPKAHNAPVIDGQAQVHKGCKRLALEELGTGQWYAALDLARCYDEALGLKKLLREIWLNGNRSVVVCDTLGFKEERPGSITYHWHGHPDAAWWAEEQTARIGFEDQTLWITSACMPIAAEGLARLRGSRGQLTLTSCCDLGSKRIWWQFELADEKPEPITLDADGSAICMGELRIKSRS